MKRQARLAKYEYRRKRKKFTNRLFLIIVLISILIFVLSRVGFFNVKDIAVQGNERVKETEIIKASGLNIGENYFNISPSSRVQDIEKIPLIKSAKLKLNLKRQAVIEVTEREPKYQFENFLEYYILDESLRIISVENSKNNIPIINDDIDNFVIGEYVYKDENIVNFFKELTKQSIYSKIKTINLGSENSFTTNDGIQVIMGNFNNLEYKFKMLDEILKDIEATGKNAKKIELDKENPVVMIDEQVNEVSKDA